VQFQDGLVFLDVVSRLGQAADACRVAYIIFLPRPARAQPPRRDADGEGVEAGDVAGLPGLEGGLHVSCFRERGAGVAALGLDHFPEGVEGAAARYRFLRVGVEAGQLEHLSREGVGDFHQVFRALPLEGLDGFGDFERVADGAAERGVHAGDEGPGSDVVLFADGDHGAG